MDGKNRKSQKVAFVQLDDGNVIGRFRSRRNRRFKDTRVNVACVKDIEYDKLIVLLFLKLELEKLGFSTLSLTLQSYLRRTLFTLTRDDESCDHHESDTPRTTSSIHLRQGSLEEEMSETDMVEEELKRMELEQYNDVL